ncbi:MAG: phosphoribosylglycinamide formyltransferase [Candidatus Latescibacteria bacterium]|nr:phosphoribosylglycinamide formyltransferase [Candidatus Latescibacterota bacterium]
MTPLNLAVLASGGGTNLQAVLDAIASGRLRARVRVVISNKPDAGALDRARRHDIPALHLARDQFPTADAFADHLLAVLSDYQIDLIILAGYLKKLHPRVVQAYRHRVLNIHPALLPSFGGKGMYGIHVHEAVIAAGVKVSGVTVHLSDEEYDHGPIVAQRPVPVLDDDTPESLAGRVLEVEHQLYPEIIQLFAEGRVRVDGRRAYIKDEGSGVRSQGSA